MRKAVFSGIAAFFRDPGRRKLFVAVLMAAILLAAVSLSAAVFVHRAFGWLSENRRTDGRGMRTETAYKDLAVALYHGDMTPIGDWSEGDDIPFAPDIPGSEKIFVLKVTNLHASLPFSVVGFGLEKPTESEEVPIRISENGGIAEYWLSTQLCAIAVNLGAEAPTAEQVAGAMSAVGVGEFLTETPQEGDPAPRRSALLSSPTQVPAGGSLYVAFRITFYNHPDKNQKVYRNFGAVPNGQTPAPCCHRRMYFEIE